MKRTCFFTGLVLSAATLGSTALVHAQTLAPLGAVAPPNLAPMRASDQFDVRVFGAKGDGTALDSVAINAAIAAAAAAGGGTVDFPAGTYLSLSIRLQSNVRLHLEQGAVLLAAERTETQRYDVREQTPNTKFQDAGHSYFHNSLIWGDGLQNVSIDGPGEIYGKGLLRDWTREDGFGDKAIALKNCRNVSLTGFTIRHGGWFGILATGVDNLVIDGLKIDTNRDGMDIDCCRNVRVSNCSVNSPTDDGICLKSSYALGEARATQNVTITNCLVSGYDEGALLSGTYAWTPRSSPTGRIKFGTESNGGFQNITVSNCVFDKCRGFALETVDGGLLEDVSINNITMRDIVNAPIFLRLARRMRGPVGTPVGELRRINISNVVVYNADAASCVVITGVPDNNIEDVSISNVQMWFKGGGTTAHAAITPPESETGYPEPGTLGRMPAYGFYLRHVKGITLDNIQFHLLSADARPAIALDDVQDADFNRIKTPKLTGASSINAKNTTNLTLRAFDGVKDGQTARVEQGAF